MLGVLEVEEISIIAASIVDPSTSSYLQETGNASILFPDGRSPDIQICPACPLC